MFKISYFKTLTAIVIAVKLQILFCHRNHDKMSMIAPFYNESCGNLIAT